MEKYRIVETMKGEFKVQYCLVMIPFIWEPWYSYDQGFKSEEEARDDIKMLLKHYENEKAAKTIKRVIKF